MDDDNNNAGRDALWWVVCGIAIGIALCFAFSGLRASDNWNTLDNWIGQNGIIGSGAALLAVAGAIAAGIGAYLGNERSKDALLLAEKTDLAVRFQKGAELLGSVGEAPKVAGIQLLSAVALEAPERYQKNVVRTLRQLLVERTKGAVDRLYAELRGEEDASVGEGGDGSNFPPRSGLLVASALGAIARTRSVDRWRGMEHENDRQLHLSDVFLSSARILDADFSAMHFSHAAIGSSRFVGCRFQNALIEACVWGTVTFQDCELIDCEIDFSGRYGADGEKSLRLRGCRNVHLVVNGLLVPDQDELKRPLRLERGGDES